MNSLIYEHMDGWMNELHVVVGDESNLKELRGVILLRVGS